MARLDEGRIVGAAARAARVRVVLRVLDRIGRRREIAPDRRDARPIPAFQGPLGQVHATVLRLALAFRRHVDRDVPEVVAFLRRHVDRVDRRVLGPQGEHDRLPGVHREDVLVREQAHRGVPAFPEDLELSRRLLFQHEGLDRVQVVRGERSGVLDGLQVVPTQIVGHLVDGARPGLFHRGLARRQGIEEQAVAVDPLALARTRPQVVDQHRNRVAVLNDRHTDDLARRCDGDRRVVRPEFRIDLAPARERLRIEVDDRAVGEQRIVERPGVRDDVVRVPAIRLHLVQDGDRVPGSLREDDVAAGVIQAIPSLRIARADAPPLERCRTDPARTIQIGVRPDAHPRGNNGTNADVFHERPSGDPTSFRHSLLALRLLLHSPHP